MIMLEYQKKEPEIKLAPAEEIRKRLTDLIINPKELPKITITLTNEFDRDSVQ
ncbi:hypothetical protein [Vallitalea guaymasensis]|uniref:hypothetical protein n=1 Tax=Vallitalea guaymasensis TaxID=1185412 RepID=UPI00187D52A6|nr:hypothetical protein [Vallitalea guaymasensis]